MIKIQTNGKTFVATSTYYIGALGFGKTKEEAIKELKEVINWYLKTFN